MYVAIDPGLNVGVAFVFDNGAWGTLTIPPPDDLDSTTAVEELLWCLTQPQPAREVVIERFVSRSQMVSKYGLYTIELVGATKALCLLHNIPLVWQYPSHKVTRVPTAREMLAARKRALGRQAAFKYTDHEVDALAHLLRRGHVLDTASEVARAGA